MARIRIRDVETAVCLRFNLTPAVMQSPARSLYIARPRQIAMYLCREMTGQSLPQIGGYFNRDHTTVMHAIDRMNELQITKPKIAEYVAECRSLVVPTLPTVGQ